MAVEPQINVFESIALAVFVAFYLPSEYQYVKYVDLGQFTKQVGKFLVEAIGFSLFIGAIALFFDWSSRSSHSLFDSILSPIPSIVWVVLGTAYSTWILGRSQIQFPKLDLKQWLVVNVIVLICFVVLTILRDYGANLPIVVKICIPITMWVAIERYKKLIAIGKLNYKLQQMISDAQRAAVDN